MTQLILRGEDARAFRRQLDEPPPKAAHETAQRGLRLARELAEKGSVRICL